MQEVSSNGSSDGSTVRSRDGSRTSSSSGTAGGPPSSWRDEFHLWRSAQPAGLPPHRRRSAAAAANAHNWRSQYAKWTHLHTRTPPAPPAAGAAPGKGPLTRKEKPELRTSFSAPRGRLPNGNSMAAMRDAQVPFGLQPTAYKVVDGQMVPVHVDAAKLAADRTPQTEEELMQKADDIDEWHRQQWGELEGEVNDP